MTEASIIYKYYNAAFDNKPDTIFDIGANIGRVSKDLRALYPNTKIYCFEPYPEIFDELTKRSENYICVKAAVSDFIGTSKFYKRPLAFEGNDQWTGDSSMLYRDLYGEDEVIEVNVITAESFMEDYNIKTIDIVKIDVEGAGMQVLTGFGKKLNDISLIYIESEEYQTWYGQNVYVEIAKYLEENGFGMYNYVTDWFQNNTIWINESKITKENRERILRLELE